MGTEKHFQASWVLCVVTCVISLGGISGNALGNDPNSPYGNIACESIIQGMSTMGGDPNLPFDPDDYSFLIYEGESNETRIRDAIEKIGITTYTVCDKDHPITANLLNTHDILIVGWDSSSDQNNKAGLVPSVIEAGITGRVILSGHDTDYHVMEEDDEYAALPFFVQEIDYVLNGNGTGLLVCADITNNHGWLPESWGISSLIKSGSKITSFTQAGVDSGLFDGLQPDDMSGWSTSYHNAFLAWRNSFQAFEMGEKIETGHDVVTIAAPKNPIGFDLFKFDDVNEITECISPLSEDPNLTYTIAVASQNQDHTNVWVVDHLPRSVDFISASSNGDYDFLTHTCSWYLPTLAGYDPNDPNDPHTYFYLHARVNYLAEPAGEIVNVVTAESDTWYSSIKTTTPVCCWGGDVIYVDKNAPGYTQIGTDWETAYRDLRDALARADKGCGSVIRVADEVYNPGDTLDPFEEAYTDTFVIPDEVSVYGGYMGYGAADPNTRDPKRYQTILSGYIGEYARNNTVVTMGDNTLLDGVIIEEGIRGILGDSVNFTLENCTIDNNTQQGIYGIGGDVIILWCKIRENGYQGIYHSGNGYSLTVENSKIHDNQQDGIYTEYSTSTILNSSIYQNGSSSNPNNTFYGISLVNSGANTEIRNNTIVYNTKEGIRRLNGNLPDVQNCIVYYNNDDDSQLVGVNLEQIYYCCVPDCNDVNNQHNKNDPPGFAYSYPEYGYFHLNWDSPCRDAGDPDEQNYVGIGEVDMDKDDRAGDGMVDIGADEVTCEYYTSDPNDWNGDGVINYGEFLFLSRAWLSRDPNDPAIITDPNYSEDPDYADQETLDRWEQAWFPWGKTSDMDHDLNIDLADLELFLDNWLWKACWWENYIAVYGMMSGNGESMMMMMSISMMESVQETPMAETKSIEEQIMDLEEIIEFLEKIWMEDPYIQQEIDEEDWKEFMDAVYSSLYELKT